MLNNAFKDPEVTDRFAQGLVKAGWPKPHRYYKINPENRLTGEEIRDLLFGKRQSGINIWLRRQWWKESTKEGKFTRRLGGRTYSGTEWIEGNMLCTQHQNLFKGMIIYGTVFRNPEGTPERKDEYLSISDAGLAPFSIVD